MKDSKILIVEDEVLIAEHLAKILEKQGFTQIVKAHKLQRALDILSKEKFDLALLDINLERDTEGVSIAKLIEAEYKFPYIFITAQTDPLVLGMAVKLHPSAFITKPFNKVDVAMAVELAIGKKENVPQNLVFKDGWSTVKVVHNDIQWAEADGNYIHLHCANKTYTIRYSLSWLEEALNSQKFVKIHRSRIVNLKHIDKMDSQGVWVNGDHMMVSKSKITEVKMLFEKT